MCSSVLSGVIDSLATTTVAADIPIPSRFIACVKQQKSVERLQSTYGSHVEVFNHKHAEAVAQSDVVLLGCKPQLCRRY